MEVNRLINSDPYRAPSTRIYYDRFMPSRSGSNFALFGLEPSPNNDGPGSYASLLRRALFGPDTPSGNIFRYRTETQRPGNWFSPFGSEEAPGVRRGPVKSPRKILGSPYKVLDAPGLEDDFNLNLVDWSAQNVVAVGLGSCVYLWNVSSNTVTELCDLGDSVCVSSVCWAPCGERLAVGTSSGTLQIWDVESLKRIRTMEGHRLRVGASAWSSLVLSSGSKDKTILQRDPRSQEGYVSKLKAHRSEVCGLKWSYDKCTLASGGNDNKLFVWNQQSTQPVLKYSEHTAAVKAIAWSPHLHGLLASGGGTDIRFWNTAKNTHLSCVDTSSQVCNLVWSKNVNELVSTHGDPQNEIIVWKYPTMSKVATLTGHSLPVLYLAVSPDGQKMVTGAGNETLKFWDVFPAAKSQSRASEPWASSLGRTTIRKKSKTTQDHCSSATTTVDNTTNSISSGKKENTHCSCYVLTGKLVLRLLHLPLLKRSLKISRRRFNI